MKSFGELRQTITESPVPPNILVLRRTTIRQFPNNTYVALYYCERLDKYFSVPYGENVDAPVTADSIHEEKTSQEKELERYEKTKTLWGKRKARWDAWKKDNKKVTEGGKVLGEAQHGLIFGDLPKHLQKKVKKVIRTNIDWKQAKAENPDKDNSLENVWTKKNLKKIYFEEQFGVELGAEVWEVREQLREDLQNEFDRMVDSEEGRTKIVEFVRNSYEDLSEE